MPNLFKKSALLLTITASAAFSPAFANDYKVGDLIIDHPVTRATAPGAKVAGGYLTIKNTGSAPDRLIGGAAEFSGKVEIHEMKMENQIMKMQQVAGGLEIAPGTTVQLKPGGYHVMFMKLGEQLNEGQSHKVTLTFEKAGSIDVMFEVKSIAETMHKHGTN